MTRVACPVCGADDSQVMQKDDGHEGLCNVCGYAWGGGYPTLGADAALTNLRHSYRLLAQSMDEGQRKFKAMYRQIAALRRCCQMVREELTFGGDWYRAQALIQSTLAETEEQP